MKDLINKIDNLILEAEIKPGERKEISFRIKKLEKLKKKLETYKRSLNDISYATLPPEMEEERKQLQKKLNLFVSKVEVEYDELYRKYQGQFDTPIKLENLLKGIKKNCGQIVKIYQQLNGESFAEKRFIYRGIRASEDALYGKPFTNRLPKDSYENLDKMAENALKNAGFKARRTNSIFASGDYNQAKNYGNNVYIIFPVDNFYFTYSEKVRDLVLNNEYMEYFIDQDVKKELLELVKKYWEKENTDGPIHKRFSSKDAIEQELFYSYYEYTNDIDIIKRWVNQGVLPEKAKTLTDKIFSNEQGFLDYMNFVDDDIYRAIMSHHEIYINSAYYAIKNSYISQVINFLKNADTSDVKIPDRLGEAPEIYSTGDIVEFIAGDYKGKLGVVESSSLDNLTIAIAYNNSVYGVDPKNVSLVENQNDYKFKENDRVIITNPDNPFYGHSGSVYETLDTTVKITIDDVGVRKYISPIELVKETPELIDYYQDKKKKIFTTSQRVVVLDTNSPFYNMTGVVESINSTGHVELIMDGSNVQVTFDPKYLKLLTEYDKTPKPVIGRGDKVKIKGYSKDLNGKIGTALNFYSDGDVAVKIEGVKSTGYINLKYLELYDEDKDVSNLDKEIKIGDIVRITSTTSSSYGEKGIVKKIDYKSSIDKEDPILEIHRPYKDPAYVRLTDVKKIYVKDKNGTVLNVGDNVKLVNLPYGTSLEDTIFKIKTFIVTNNGQIKIIDNNGKVKTVSSNILEKTTDSSNKFKAGDKVTVIGSSTLSGEKGKVVKTFTAGGKNYADVELETVSNQSLTFEEDELELVGTDSNSQDQIKVGDTVKNIKHGHNYFGKTGEVTTIFSSGNVGLVYSDGMKAIDPPQYLVKVGDDSSATSSKLKIGDKVKIKAPQDIYNNWVGKIEKGPDPDGDFVVTFGVGDWSYYSPAQLEKIEEPNDDTEFKVGDKVKVIGPSAYNVDDYNGSVGTIYAISDNKKYVSIKFNEHDNITYPVENIEKLETKETNSKVHTGDIVSITGSSIVSDNTLGLVIDDKNNIVQILEGGSYQKSYTIPDDHMNIVPPYQIGETVKIINPDLSTFGTIGVIEEINDTMVKVKSQELIAGFTIVKKTSIKREKTQDKKPETNKSSIKVGDYVRINYPGSPIDGKAGVVQYVGPQYADVVIPPAPDHDPYVIPIVNLVKSDKPTEFAESIMEGDIVEVVNPKYPEYQKKKFKALFVTESNIALIIPIDDPKHSSLAFSVEELKKIS